MRVYLAAIVLTLAALPEAGSPARAAAFAHADTVRLPARDAPYMRYLWVSTPARHRDDFLIALKLQCNLLSTQGKLATPVLIAPDVVRLDVRDYGWDKKLQIWEGFARADVFFHVKIKFLVDTRVKTVWPGGFDRDFKKDFERGRYNTQFRKGETLAVAAPWLPDAINGLRFLTYSEAPILMAEWFFVQTARQVSIRNKQEGTGYYDFLGLKTRDDFFRLTGTDPKVAAKIFREWRAVVSKSGVSQQNRQIVALGAASGRTWITLDTFTEQDRGVSKRNLRDGEMAHDAEELYSFLPNGLWVTFLANAKGEAQESAPDKIGADDSTLRVGRDGRIHANLSCIRCHGVDREFLKPVNDWARRTFRSTGVLRLQDPDKKVVLELESQYLRDMDRLLARDRAEYMDAVREVTASKLHPKGLTAGRLTRIYGEVWNRYVEAPVTAADAARELGVSTAVFRDAVFRYAKARGGGDLLLTSYIDNQPLTRLEWEDSYSLAATVALGLQPQERLEERKIKKEKGK